ncbi:hypothetical protein SCUCBS95973_000716 [Sporothrix curviconia]|uniref:Protein kinase domain-containing protein n=1 Tax=Sporothrix curviconia TaxID=1260050 RepID=A0ABP0ASW2_9PEZI
MGEVVMPSSQLETEEKTEPFPSSEYASRLHSLRVQESFVASGSAGSVHLDELVVPSDKDIRLLVRPLRSRSVSPGSNDNCEWVALRTEVASPGQPHETVLAVTQTAKDIKFTVLMPGERHSDGTPIPPLWCELYYDPSSDNGILLNNCDVPISLSRIYPALSPPASADGTPTTSGTPTTNGAASTSLAIMSPSLNQDIEYTINPGTIKALSPGTWRIRIGHIDVLDFRILKRRRTLFKALPPPPPPIPDDSQTSSGKRSFVADEDDVTGPEARRQKTTDDGAEAAAAAAAATGNEVNKEAVVMFLRPTADPLVFPLPSSANKGQELGTRTNSHVLLDMESEDTVVVPGSCEIDSYTLTKRDPIASTSLSTVFTATMDHPEVPPGSIITVKVIKTRPALAPPPSPGRGGNARAVQPAALRPQELERVVVRQADTWLREYQSHKYLKHDSIVRLYGGDARFLSLHMEHVDAKDLSKKGTWRAINSDYFTGDRRDALRILRDISNALNYVHGLHRVHNDVKPANILYSRERGAVLCDFGLSTETKDSQSSLTGGTPYYVPPEFIGRKLRGPPSDVWALGITMLYVLRKMEFPDTRGGRHRAKPLYWLIADVNKAPSAPSQNPAPAPAAPSAATQMKMWLSEVTEAKEKLNREDKIERLTYEMLSPNPVQRITMKRLVSELFHDGPVKKAAV